VATARTVVENDGRTKRAGTGTISTFWRRRQYIVDSRLQLGLIGSFFLLLAIFLFVLTLTIFGPPIRQLLAGAESSGELVKSSQQLLALDARYWPAIALALVLVTIMAVKVTHRLAGPLYRFKAIFHELGREQVPPAFKLREGDYLMREAELLNAALSRLRSREAAMQELRVELKELEADRQEAGDTETASRIHSLLQHHRKNCMEPTA